MMEPEEQTEKSGEKTEEVTEENFLKELYFFMKQRDTPIERIPHLGFKQIDLYLMYKTVKELGGYHQVTAQQLWKKVYNILGGNPRSTSAATCTRRHYEKLLLPYECHLAGYGADIPITHPRSATKRIRPEDDYLLGLKRASLRHLSTPVPRDFHMETGGVGIFPMPLNIPHYIHAGSPSVPSYFSLPYKSIPTISELSPPPFKRPTLSYLPSSPCETEVSKRPLEHLRYLAEEYKTISGLVEPLNLSKKQGKLETSSDTPSSFAPPSTKKFLNGVYSLYPHKVAGMEEESEQSGVTGGSSRAKVPAPAQAVVNPISADESEVMALTSSSGSSPTSLKTFPSPTVRRSPGNIPSYLGAAPVKKIEQNLHLPWAKPRPSEAPQASNGHASPGQATCRPPQDPYGGMEIQIPLSLLQNWIKEGLLFSSPPGSQHLMGHGVHDTVHMSSPFSRRSPDSADNNLDHPADLSLKSHARDVTNSSKRDYITDTLRPFINTLMTKESQTPSVHRYASVKPFQLSASAKASISRELHLKASQAQDHDASAKQTQSATMMNREGSDHESLETGFSVAVKPGKTSEKLREASPSMLNGNSTSPPLIQISPEHLKLLLSNAPFRLERSKIC